MTHKAMHTGILCFFAMMVLGLIFLLFHLFSQSEKPLLTAEKFYNEGLQSDHDFKRNQAFNNALSIYLDLENQYQPIRGNGNLYLRMGQIYDYLEQYPWAVLYFNQAKALMPRNKAIEGILNQTLEKLEIPPEKPDSIFRQIFFFHYVLALSERLQLISLLTVLVFLCASLYVWTRYKIFKSLIVLLLSLWACFFLSVIFTKYFEPLQGVFIKSAMLYRDRNPGSTYVDSEPLFGGSKVEVLDILDEGSWFKISTSKGTIGYVPSESIRLIKI